MHRYDWIEHVKQAHWKTWVCRVTDCQATFNSSQSCQDHLFQMHSDVCPAWQIESAVQICEEPMDIDNVVVCLLCGSVINSFEEYQQHVGSEQEQISLLALPNAGLEDNGREWGYAANDTEYKARTNMEEIKADDKGKHPDTDDSGPSTISSPPMTPPNLEVTMLWMCCGCGSSQKGVACLYCGHNRCHFCMII